MKLMIDSNILIFSNVAEMPEHDMARDRLLALINDGHSFAVNTIIVSEVNFKLQKILNGEEAYERTMSLLHSNHIDYYPVDQNTLENAIELNHRQKMRINDAVIAQHCLDMRLDGIFTDNVRDFKRVPGLHIVPLREDNR